jgi:hypothetical protein
MIKVYKKKIVVFTPNYKTSLVYSISMYGGDVSHVWESEKGDKIYLNANG